MTRERRARILGLTALISLQAGFAQPDPIQIEVNPSDFVPLAVGNRWTYEHFYYNGSYPMGDWGEDGPGWLKPLEIPGYPHGGPPDSYPPDSLTTATKTLTTQITHTETIDGLEYFVFSDPEYAWPPLPEFFWGGKKVRVSLEGFLVFRWDGQDVPLYDFGQPHHLDTYTLTHEYTIALPPEASTAYASVGVQRGMHFYADRRRVQDSEFSPLYQLSQVLFYLHSYGDLSINHYCDFLQGYGVGAFEILALGVSWDPLISVRLTPISANIDGVEIPHPEHTLSYPFSFSSVQPTSWGHVKSSVLRTR